MHDTAYDAATFAPAPDGVRVREEAGGRVVLELRRRWAVPPGALTLLVLLAAVWLILRYGDVSRARVWVPAAIIVAIAVSAAFRAFAQVMHRTTVAADGVAVEVHERPLSAGGGVLVPSALLGEVRVAERASPRRGAVSVVADGDDGVHLLVRDAGSPAAAAYVAARIAAAIRPTG